MYITIYPSGLCRGHIEYPKEEVGVILKDAEVVYNFGNIYPEWITAATSNYDQLLDICSVHDCSISIVE